MSKTRQILEPFFNPFWDDFQGFGKVKNKGFVWEGCIFLIFRRFAKRSDLKNEKKVFKRGSKSKPKKDEKRKANTKENYAKPAELAAGVMSSGKEELGPELGP